MTIPVQVLLGGRLDLDDWQRRHAAGLVPDEVPYGLGRMADHGYAVDRSPVAGGQQGPRAVLRGALRRTGGGYDWALPAVWAPTADLVLSWDERAGVPVALAHGRRRVVVTNVIWATDAPPRSGALRAAVRGGLRRAGAVFVHSSAQAPALVRELGVRAERVHPIAFGVDADFFVPGDPSGVDGDLLLSVGNDRHRDWPTVLAAFARVRERRPRTRLVVVSRTVPAAAAAAGGVEVVASLGHADLRALQARAAASVVLTRPNLHVSGATAVLESLAVARPAVATGTPGMADYADGGGALTLVPPGDARRAAEVLLELLDDPSGGSERGAAGRRAVEGAYSTAHHARRLAGVLDAARARS